TGAALNQINISANQPITFNQSIFNANPLSEGDSLLSIDASASSAGITMETDFESHILDIVGGSGDDHFDMEEGDAFDGGNGDDTAHFSSSVFGEFFFGETVALANNEVLGGAVVAAVVGGAMLDSSLINVETVLVSDGMESTFNFSQQTEDLIFEVLNSDFIELIAGSGNDTLIASVGEEFLTGGLGADEFSMNFPGTAVSFGQDIITDFTVADGDQLDLDGAGTQAKNISGLSQLQLVGNGSRDDEVYIANTELVLIDNSAPDVISVASFTSIAVADYLVNVGGNSLFNLDSVVFEKGDSLFYLVVSDGIDSAVFAADAALGNGDLTIDAAELVLIATLEGITDTSSLAGSFIF
ncbi:MAG: hypothetical protein GQ582_09630, partial [Methyloprofundus sp.]|nr:hypothetical protein [Methyloprofundus sp.]